MAVDWLARLEQAAERRRAQAEAEDSIDAERAKGEAMNVLPINPRSLEGMDLNFTRKTSLKEIFQQLSKNSGVNIVLHSSASAQDIQVSVDLRGLSFQRVLDTLMLQSDLFYKVMDPNSIMVFKKTPQNLQEYENKLIQTFYLSNAEVENVRQIFNALMPQLRVFIDKRLNAITVMAKPSDLAHRPAHRQPAGQGQGRSDGLPGAAGGVRDRRARPVGLLPVVTPTDTDGHLRLGATTERRRQRPQPASPARSAHQQELHQLPAAQPAPGHGQDQRRDHAAGQPQRAGDLRRDRGGEHRREDQHHPVQHRPSVHHVLHHLGHHHRRRRPSPASPASHRPDPYSYEDVGVKIKVKPRVHFNGDITIDLESKIKTLQAGGDPGRPNLSQRVIKTSARLRDGETAIFGGLLKEDEAKNLQGIWGVSSIPIIGDLLGNHTNTKDKTDVILSIRAVVVRKPDLAEDDFEAFDPDQAPSAAKPFAPRPAKDPPPCPDERRPGDRAGRARAPAPARAAGSGRRARSRSAPAASAAAAPAAGARPRRPRPPRRPAPVGPGQAATAAAARRQPRARTWSSS